MIRPARHHNLAIPSPTVFKIPLIPYCPTQGKVLVQLRQRRRAYQLHLHLNLTLQLQRLFPLKQPLPLKQLTLHFRQQLNQTPRRRQLFPLKPLKIPVQ